MSKATADKGVDFVFAEARKNGIEKLLIMFFGGEPLIEKELLLHIADRFIREKGDIEVNFQMSTNGTLLTPDLLDELLRRRIYISLSIDGSRQRPNAAGKGTSKMIEKAGRLLRRMLRNLWIGFSNRASNISPQHSTTPARGQRTICRN